MGGGCSCENEDMVEGVFVLKKALGEVGLRLALCQQVSVELNPTV